MKKGIYLQATIVPPGNQTAKDAQTALQQALAGPHDGLTIQIKRVRAADGAIQAILYLEGEQAAPDDFAALTTAAVQRLWQATLAAHWKLQRLDEIDDYQTDEEDDSDMDQAARAAAPAAPEPAAGPATPAPAPPAPMPGPADPSAPVPVAHKDSRPLQPTPAPTTPPTLVPAAPPAHDLQPAAPPAPPAGAALPRPGSRKYRSKKKYWPWSHKQDRSDK